jgi:hypothetical protein
MYTPVVRQECVARSTRMRIVFNANRTPMSGRNEKKKKYLLAVSMKINKYTCGSTNISTSNNNNNNINLTLYELGSRQTVLTIATK